MDIDAKIGRAKDLIAKREQLDAELGERLIQLGGTSSGTPSGKVFRLRRGRTPSPDLPLKTGGGTVQRLGIKGEAASAGFAPWIPYR